MQTSTHTYWFVEAKPNGQSPDSYPKSKADPGWRYPFFKSNGLPQHFSSSAKAREAINGLGHWGRGFSDFRIMKAIVVTQYAATQEESFPNETQAH